MRSISPSPPIEYITIKEAVGRSGWSAGHIRSLAQCGKLESSRPEGRILIDAECLSVLLRARAAVKPRPNLRLVVSNDHL